MVRGKNLEIEEYFRPRNFSFGQGNLEKMINVKKFKTFPHKKMIINRFIKSIISTKCKHFMARNITFLIFMV